MKMIYFSQKFLQKYLISTLVVGMYFFVLNFVFTSNANAQTQSIGLAISPPTFELNGAPGDILYNTIRAENISDASITVELDKRNFNAVGDEGQVGLTEEDTGTYSLASWISFPIITDAIPPKSTKVFAYKITIPQNAEPGGHFGSVVFKITSQQDVSTGSGAKLSQEVASLMLLKVAGQTKEEASIKDFKPSQTFYEYPPIKFDLEIQNEGNVHIKPTGNITITNFFGKKVAGIDITPKNVLPGATRKISTDWTPNWLIGKYTATISTAYGSDNKILTATTTFIAFPYKIIGGILIAIAIIAFTLYKGRKRLSLAIKVLTGKADISD